jgi:hypothetical protein
VLSGRIAPSSAAFGSAPAKAGAANLPSSAERGAISFCADFVVSGTMYEVVKNAICPMASNEARAKSPQAHCPQMVPGNFCLTSSATQGNNGHFFARKKDMLTLLLKSQRILSGRNIKAVRGTG